MRPKGMQQCYLILSTLDVEFLLSMWSENIKHTIVSHSYFVIHEDATICSWFKCILGNKTSPIVHAAALGWSFCLLLNILSCPFSYASVSSYYLQNGPDAVRKKIKDEMQEPCWRWGLLFVMDYSHVIKKKGKHILFFSNTMNLETIVLKKEFYHPGN